MSELAKRSAAQSMKLGLYIDGAFRADERGAVHCGTELFGFMRFATAVGARFDRFALIARGTDDAAATPEALPAGVELIALPDYGGLRRIGRLLGSIPSMVARIWRGIDELDAVWVTGVHPLGLLAAGLAKLRGKRIVLLIRQDSPSYFRSRLPSRAWSPLLIPLDLLDWAFRLVGRRARATVVGADVARRYRAPRPNVLEIHVTLLERPQLAAGPSAAEWDGEIRLLTVGRIAAEKSPVLVAEALADLDRADPGRYSLRWVGEGPLTGALSERAVELGVAGRLELPGFVPFGPELLELYRDSHAFVHVAATEGVPGVLYEAMGSGLPVVATDVGGVAEALRGGEAGLLVAPGDATAIADAVRRLADDPELRDRLARRGLEIASAITIESETSRVADFIAGPDMGKATSDMSKAA